MVREKKNLLKKKENPKKTPSMLEKLYHLSVLERGLRERERGG